MKINYTLPVKQINTFAASKSNQITKDYYNYLIGEINRGIILKAVCKIEYVQFNYISYHLISVI